MAHNYEVPTGEMLEDARTKHALFLLDKATFIAKDIAFDDPFAADMLQSIEDSEGQESAETREDQQQQETADVVDAMKTGLQVFAEAKYYIEKAFGTKPNIRHKFGVDDWSKASKSQHGMVTALKTLHRLCEDAVLKPQLLAVGMVQGQIDNIQTAITALLAENTEQNLFITQSTEATAARDAQYNDTFEYPQKLSRASKIVFYGNLIKINQYALPHGSAGEDFNVEGKVTDGSNNGALMKGVKVRCEELNIETFTNFAGNFGFVGVPPGIHKFTFTITGYATQDHDVTMVLNGSAKFNMILVLA